MKPMELAIELSKVDSKATAAHARMDKFEAQTVESLKGISTDVKILLAYMHGTRGRDKGILIAWAAGGGLIVFLLEQLWKKLSLGA